MRWWRTEARAPTYGSLTGWSHVLQTIYTLNLRGRPLRVELLQGLYIHLAALQRGDAFSSGPGSGQSGDRRDAGGYSSAADRLLVKERFLALRSVDDQLNPVALDQIDHMGTSFLHLVHAVASHPGSLDYVGRASCGH